jgi:hypothetical protein
VEEQGLRSSHWVDEPFDEKEKDLRRQWEALGRPPCPEDDCPNRAHPPPCDPANRDRIRAERAKTKAAKKAAKAAEQTTLPAEPPVQESKKRKASSNMAVPPAKRQQSAIAGLTSREIAAYGNAMALATSANLADRQFAWQAHRHLERRQLSTSGPQRGNSARGRGGRGNAASTSVGSIDANTTVRRFSEPRNRREGRGRGSRGRGRGTLN